MSYTENYQKWLDFAELPAYLRDELVAMDEKTKEDAFYTNLEFGTAGMRGLIGAGTNRINIYVVRQATEGLAQLIDSKGEEAKKRGVAIAYDSRHFSPEFAFESAQVLAAHGIKSYVFESLRPTPELSFAVRHLHTFAGIMVTASHNPAPFNGYKVYGEDGGQMPPADADALTGYIRAIENPFTVQLADLEESKASGLIEVIGENVDAEYLKEVKGVNINQDLINEYGRDMKIVYTPLHGTGEMLAKRKISIKIPAGVDSGSRLRVANEGEPGILGGPKGDLYVYIFVRPHKEFERNGNDVISRVNISFAQAALGATIQVNTLDGKVELKIPEGTQTGTAFRVKGKGIPYLRNPNQRGDQHIVVTVQTPKKLTDTQRELLLRFANESNEDVNNLQVSKSLFEKIKDCLTK